MLQSFKDRLAGLWESRFMFGAAITLGDLGVTRFSNNEVMVAVHGPNLISTGTGHWPFYLFEMGWASGPRGSWHLGVLGWTIGKVIVNDYDQSTGEIVGPDKSKYYFFFKGINHQNKQLEEIIYADNSPSKV